MATLAAIKEEPFHNCCSRNTPQQTRMSYLQVVHKGRDNYVFVPVAEQVMADGRCVDAGADFSHPLESNVRSTLTLRSSLILRMPACRRTKSFAPLLSLLARSSLQLTS